MIGRERHILTAGRLTFSASLPVASSFGEPRLAGRKLIVFLRGSGDVLEHCEDLVDVGAGSLWDWGWGSEDGAREGEGEDESLELHF